MRDIADGTILPVELRIDAPSVGFPGSTTNFAAGTPAGTIFGCSGSNACVADFRGTCAELGGIMTYAFFGLNPARKYQFVGAANLLTAPNDLGHTLYGIYGVDSFTSAHTSNCVTTAQTTNIGPHQVVLMTGRNAQPGFGDLVVWNDIRVGSNGSFYILASRYYAPTSAVPFGALRLVEDFVDPTAPFITKQPADLSASRASAQSLAPIVNGSLPLQFQWFKDATPLPAGTNRILKFNSLQLADAGTYWLVATNPFGTITTTNVTVTVGNDVIGIVGQPQNRSLHYGDPLSLSVTVTGTPPYFFQWFKNGSPVQDSTNSNVAILAASVQHSGDYSVRVSNLFSSALSATGVVSVVYTPLRIVDQPQSQTVTQATTLRLQVAVAGSGPSFQWFRNGTALANANSSVYRVASANVINGGNYFVVATGPLNSVTSAVVSVTIVPPAPPPQSPATLRLLALTNSWAYDQSGNDLGTTWREVGYDDSLWPRGRGVLGIETLASVTVLTNTILRLTNGAGQPIITSYFRTHFFWPTSSIGAALLFSNLIDDGAVFYLNGVPIFSQNMPPGEPTSLTLAPSPSPEGVFVLTNLPAPMIAEGDNVLAVEVHQNSPTSVDIVFGTAVFGYNIPDAPLSIVQSPHSQTVLEGQPLELNLLLNAPARIQWYRDGLPLNYPYGPRFFIGAAAPSDAGQYFAIATNNLGAVTSAVAVVEVIPDTQPPRVVSAVLQTNRTQIVIQFGERLLPATATNLGNFHVQTADGIVVASVVSATYDDQQVLLSLSAAPPQGTTLVLRLNGVTDLAVAANQLNDVLVPIRQFISLVPLQGNWSYNDTGADLGTAWRETFYDDSLWPSGLALLYNDNAFAGFPDSPPVIPPPLLVTNTWIQLTNDGVPIITHYFRRSIDLGGASPLGAQLSLQTMIDDGAVMYLNGSEFFRLGVTNDPVYATNTASRGRGTSMEGTLEGPFLTTPTNFVSGSNVLAVEVHQLSLADMSFGAEVTLLAKSFTNEPVRILRQPADVLVREGQPFAFEVESIAAVNAQWLKGGVSISGANGEILSIARAALSDDGARYLVVLSNAFSFALSSVATLHVLADTNPPVLLSADALQSLTEITLTFSEPLDPASISNLAQYIVRGSDGQLIQITGATLVNETNILLVTALRSSGRNYEVRVSGVRDSSVARNEIEPGSGAALGYEFVLVPLLANWKYDQSGNGNVEAWKLIGFDDSEWLIGQALLFNDPFPPAVPAVPFGTIVSQANAGGTPIITHYFRHSFHLPVLAEGAALSIRHAVDDSVAIYLNGAPVVRANLPAGTIDATTLASLTVSDAVLSTPTLFAFAGPAGASVLAAETHQGVNGVSDVAFAAELTISRTSTALSPIGPALRISRFGNQLQFSWEGNYLLESASTVSGDWNVIANATSPLVTNAVNAAEFYRLRKP